MTFLRVVELYNTRVLLNNFNTKALTFPAPFSKPAHFLYSHCYELAHCSLREILRHNLIKLFADVSFQYEFGNTNGT